MQQGLPCVYNCKLLNVVPSTLCWPKAARKGGHAAATAKQTGAAIQLSEHPPAGADHKIAPPLSSFHTRLQPCCPAMRGPHSRLIAACSGTGSRDPGIRRRAHHENFTTPPPDSSPCCCRYETHTRPLQGKGGRRGEKHNAAIRGLSTSPRPGRTRAGCGPTNPPPPARVMYNPHSHAHIDDLAWRL